MRYSRRWQSAGRRWSAGSQSSAGQAPGRRFLAAEHGFFQRRQVAVMQGAAMARLTSVLRRRATPGPWSAPPVASSPSISVRCPNQAKAGDIGAGAGAQLTRQVGGATIAAQHAVDGRGDRISGASPVMAAAKTTPVPSALVSTSLSPWVGARLMPSTGQRSRLPLTVRPRDSSSPSMLWPPTSAQLAAASSIPARPSIAPARALQFGEA